MCLLNVLECMGSVAYTSSAWEADMRSSMVVGARRPCRLFPGLKDSPLPSSYPLQQCNLYLFSKKGKHILFFFFLNH